MDKKKLIEQIIQQLENDLEAAIIAAKATYEAATHEESKPENEYDTRGLEASYLAGAQAKRVGEIEETLYVFRNSQVKEFSKDVPIAATALVEIQLAGQKPSWVLIMLKGGGLRIQFAGRSVQVITANSPLGEALVGLQPSDFVTVETGAASREYEILFVC